MSQESKNAVDRASFNDRSNWTGGQWSLVRIILGIYLFIHFFDLIPYATELFSSAGVLAEASLSPLSRLFINPLGWIDAPWFVTAFIVTGLPASVMLVLGWKDRWAAVWLWWLLACCFGRNPLISNPSLPYVGWLLLFHSCLPSEPYLSLDGAGRTDPDGDWQMSRHFKTAAWILLAVGYTYSGIDKLLSSPSWQDGTAFQQVLNNALARDTGLRVFLLSLPAFVLKGMTWSALLVEILYLPLSLSRKTRPWIWLAAVGMQIGILFCVDFADLTFGMLIFHLAAFDPEWLSPTQDPKQSLIAYDGSCGACHSFVRFVLAEDRAGQFRFQPLSSPEVEKIIQKSALNTVPESVLVIGDDQTSVKMRSDAVISVLHDLGGLWRALAGLIWIVPRPIRDWAYDQFAKRRHVLFAKPEQACPLLPPHLSVRFQ